MASAVWEMTQHRDPGGCSLSFLLRATNTTLSSSFSSALCPPSAGAQGNWLQMKFCTLALYRLSASPAISPCRQKLCCSSQLYVIWVPFWLWCCRLGIPAWDLDPTLLRGITGSLQYSSSTSADTHGSPASPLAPPPHYLPVTLC